MLGKLKLSSAAKTVMTVLLTGGVTLAMVSFSVTMESSRFVKETPRIVKETSRVVQETHSRNDIQKNEFYDTRSVVNETQSVLKGNYSLGYTEKKQPLVRIYDYFPGNETEADKARRFDQMETWLRGITETKPDVERKCTNSTKTILWFDVRHKGTGIRNACRRVDFSQCECRCEVDFFIFNESDTQKLYEPFGGDAILLQINKLKNIGHPPRKRPGQVFVAVEREPTAAGGIQQQHFEYVFNWTMTFRRDSDIFYPYGEIVQRKGKTPVKNYTAIYKKKKKGIIWFVSHCRTKSRREYYAEALSKYIDIDIVGKCGRDICPKGFKKCVERLEEKYFFSFNLENSYLTDYVTEKLFDNFAKEMIQIVGGSADYDKLAPDRTVIDEKKFDTPEDLATYLKLLMSREDLYTEYLRTKDNYRAQSQLDISQRSYCELCSMLHDPDKYQNLYYSIREWFHDG